VLWGGRYSSAHPSYNYGNREGAKLKERKKMKTAAPIKDG